MRTFFSRATLARLWIGLSLFLFAYTSFAYAQSALPEEVVFIPKKVLFGTLHLETTIFKPEGNGPFPLVIINHGKSLDTRDQARSRPLSVARYFLERNYVVMVPMRQGFSKSEGSYVNSGCAVESNGRAQAEDVAAALEYAHSLLFVDHQLTLIAGQSHGGWTTLAYGASTPDPSVKGLINAAGGLRQTNCVGWEGNLIRSVEHYGQTTQLPSLWFYGDNDSYFSRDTSDEMFKRYKKGNPKTTLVSFGVFEKDAHTLFGSDKGRVIWEPYVDRFLSEVGLPNKVVNLQYQLVPALKVPPPTGFAALEDERAVPYVQEPGRMGYKNFLSKKLPRAFAVNADGKWSWEAGGRDPSAGALHRCNDQARIPCALYAVDNQVVWKRP